MKNDEKKVEKRGKKENVIFPKYTFEVHKGNPMCGWKKKRIGKKNDFVDIRIKLKK